MGSHSGYAPGTRQLRLKTGSVAPRSTALLDARPPHPMALLLPDPLQVTLGVQLTCRTSYRHLKHRNQRLNVP